MVLKKSTKDLLIKTTTLIKSLNQVQRIKKLKKEQNLQKIRKRHALELERAENSLVESLAKFFEKQAKSAVSLFEKSQPFDPRDWDVELINHCYPALAESMGEVMFSELKQYGVSVDRVKSICRSEKASTASEWLAEAGESLIEGGLLDSSLGPIDLGFMTEYPEWMKEAIRDNLEETFSQDYWKGVNDTTSSDITEILKKGAEDGWSIERMAKEMSTKFIDDGRYPMGRGRLIARTELGHALNGARSMAMDALIEEVGPELPMRKQWLSVLGTTTRDTHANLDGVPADKEGRWTLAGVKCRWPSDVTLPAKERCNCQCSIVMAFGMDDDSASELISDYSERVAKKKSINRDLIEKGSEERWSVKRGTGCGAGSPGAPGFAQQNTCNRHQGPGAGGGGGSVSQKKQPLVAAEDYSNSKAHFEVFNLKGPIAEGYQKKAKGTLSRMGFPTDEGGAREALLKLTGAPAGCSFKIHHLSNEDGFSIEFKGEGIKEAKRHVKVVHSWETGNQLIISNELFVLDDSQKGSGLGTKMLARQIEQAEKAGVVQLETVGGGTPKKYNPDSKMNGYYTWPRLGYDGDLSTGKYSKKQKDDLEKNFPKAKTVSDLMKTPEGRAWWKENGWQMDLTFKISKDSVSRKVFDQYVEAKFGSASGSKSYEDSPEDEGGESGATSRIDRERRRDSGRDLGQDVVEKVFCPTGPGGGVDPTCSPGKSKPAGVLSAYTSLGVDDDGNAIPGSVGGFSGVDTSWMKPGSVDSNWALKKIHELEKLAFGGKWDVFQKKLSKPTSTNLSKYQKAILEAQNNLLSWKNGGVSDPPPGSIPVQPNQTPQISSGSNWKKVGPQMGTEKGGVYEMGGKQYYVKIPEDSSRAVTEVLASQLYDLAYGSVVKASLVEIEGKTAYATPMLDLEKADWNSKAIKEKAAEDFAIHVWLNNRDAIGAGSENPMDNIKVQKDGSLILVDAGGSLDQKGMGGGGKKSFFHKASEWDGFRDPSVNPTMSQVFGDMTPEQLIASGKKLEQASNGLIEALCKKAGRLDLAPTLIARKNDILDRVKDLESTLKKSEPVKTAAPALAMTPIPPPPVITAKSYQAALGGKLAAIQAGIDKGDIAAIEAVKVSLTSTDAYYKKVAEWKASVLAVMKANPSAKAASQEAPSTSPAKPITPFKADPDKFPPDPVFYSSDKAMVAFNQKMVKKIKGYANSGDIQSLKDVCNEGSVEGTTIKSMKVKDWANALKNQLEEQIADYEDGLTPKAPLSETLGKILQAVPAAKSKIVEKVGKWNILGALSPSDVPVMKGTKATSHDKAVLESSGMSAYGSLTKTAQSALKSYTGTGYDDQNYSLREGKPSSSAMQTAQAIMKAGVPIKEGIVLTRYHDDYDGEFVGDSSSIKTGIVVADKGILSTSFTSAFSGRAVKWEITVGPGVRGIPVKGFSQNPSEEEVVLPPNSRLMVTKVKSEGSKALIQAIALPTEDNQCCPP